MTSNKSDNPLFWEKQRGESRQAYQAFSLYRDQGPTRSLQRVAQELSKSVALMKRWSGRWLWTARAESWDAHLDEIRTREREAHVVEHLERARRTGLLVHAIGVSALRTHEGSANPPLNVAKIVAMGLEIERRALGLPDQFVIEGKGGADPDAFRTRETIARARGLLR